MSRGQAMVEFALILPLLVLLLVMAIDFGRVFFGWVALHNAARIAADHASRGADAWPTATGPNEETHRDAYLDLVIADLSAINCTPPAAPDPIPTDTNGMWDDEDVPDPSFVSVVGNPLDSKEPGDHAVVNLRCSFDLITPLASSILGGQVRLGAEANFAINTPLSTELPPPPPPPPTPTPVPTPTPGPLTCTVPNYVTLRANDANNLWDASTFTGTFTKSGTGNFTIANQSLLPVGATVPCNSSIIVFSAAVPTPSPTPTPTSTAAPTTTPLPTPTPAPTATPVPTATAVPTPTPVPCAVPVANFTWAPVTPVRNQDVQFTSTSTTAQNCGITVWMWNLGDTTVSAAQNPTHKYNFGGNAASQVFTVTLTVTNIAGSSTSAQDITVNK
ncbi:MAG: TadE/TadG family type IV pilus assembly protein [Candidatus Limnocylindria bacterium]